MTANKLLRAQALPGLPDQVVALPAPNRKDPLLLAFALNAKPFHRTYGGRYEALVDAALVISSIIVPRVFHLPGGVSRCLSLVASLFL